VAVERSRPHVRRLVAITAVLVAVVLAWEYLSPRIGERAGEDAVDGLLVSEDQVPVVGPSPVALLDVIPTNIDGFRAVSRHYVPGSGEIEAEATFQPTDEFFTDSVPLQVYMRVAYHIDDGGATRHLVRLTSEMYGNDPGTLPLGAASALRGRSDAGAQFIGWTQGPYSFEVDARFMRIRRKDAAPEIVFEKASQAAVALEARSRQMLPRSSQ